MSPESGPARWVTTPFRADRDALFHSTLTGAAFCRAYSDLVDGWLRGLLGDDRSVALAAVGGFGRAELCPGSDIDVILLHREKRNVTVVREVAERVWYPLWDAQLRLGHGVRTVKQALALAADDLEVATSLLSVRHVAGDESLTTELATRARTQWRKRASRWMRRLAASVDERHRAAGEVAFLLEPDLKKGRGGLRDVHALAWAGAATDSDHGSGALAAAYDTLLTARVELQRPGGKATDRLVLEEQDRVAHALDYGDADALMAAVASAARTVAWTSDEAWNAEDRIELPARATVDAELVLRTAATAAKTGRRVSRQALDVMAAEMPPPPHPWPDPVRAALVDLLATGWRAIPVLETLDQCALLTRLLPEWEAVRSKPQRNAYHRFTVDRHLCETASNAAALCSRVERPDLLIVAAWLHDLGKGFPGDHTDVGVELMNRIARRLGFSAADCDVLVRLVRHHLLLADAATRRDIDDPATIDAVADAVGSVVVLRLLHALTEADSVATGPAAWGTWKAGLVRDLADRVERTMRGEDVEPTGEELDDRQRLVVDAARTTGRPQLDAAGAMVTVVASDRPGLFCHAAGTLTVHGLNILTARAWSVDDGLAVEVFTVEPAFGEEPDWAVVAADLEEVLAGRSSLEERLVQRAHDYATLPRTFAAALPRRHVEIDNQASANATVLEVRAPDAPGTLYRIARALADQQLDIRHAKVATLGHEVIDSFYVVGRDGSKIAAHEAERVERAVLGELARGDRTA